MDELTEVHSDSQLAGFVTESKADSKADSRADSAIESGPHSDDLPGLDFSPVEDSLDELSLRIIETAIELAEQGGFQAVRLRDVASKAEVALGTLYRRFRSKEDILAAALAIEMEQLEHRVYHATIEGDTHLDRVTTFFGLMTQNLVRRPNFARAVLRAVASGEPELAGRVTAFHGRMSLLLIAALKGVSISELESSHPPTELDVTLGSLLQQIWFASLVGWMGGLHDPETVVSSMRTAAELLIRGAGERL